MWYIFFMEKNISKNRIRSLREDRDLRQADVAKATGIDQRSLSNYETGKTNPDAYAIVRLAEFFGVTCDYLLGVTDRDLNSPTALVEELEDIKKRLEAIQKSLNRM